MNGWMGFFGGEWLAKKVPKKSSNMFFWALFAVALCEIWHNKRKTLRDDDW